MTEDSELPEVTIYSDGGASPNPGPGGWGAVLLRPGAKKPRELSGGEAEATNNRMELRAAIEALRSLEDPHRVLLFTDSQYLRMGITSYLARWLQRGWKTTEGEAVKNRDLWQELAEQVERHEMTWRWVRGHAGNKWNERADTLARRGRPAPPLPLDDTSAVHLFVAGSFSAKAREGGWGVVLRYGETTKELGARIAETSANRMHLCAALEGLRALKGRFPVHLYTSSDYLRDGATQWARTWQQRGWRTKDGTEVIHVDLWQPLVALCERYAITWHSVSKKAMPDELARAKEIAAQGLEPA